MAKQGILVGYLQLFTESVHPVNWTYNFWVEEMVLLCLLGLILLNFLKAYLLLFSGPFPHQSGEVRLGLGCANDSKVAWL